jgi:hypothetical protein
MTEKSVKRLNGSSIGQTVSKRNSWLVNVSPDVTREDLLSKEYWTHVANRLRPLDHIEVVVDNGSKWYLFMVLKANTNEAILKLLVESGEDDGRADEDVQSEYEVKYAGPVAKHRIIRRSDGRVMEEGISTKEEAYARLATYEKVAA